MRKILYVTTISGFLPQFELNDVKLIQQMGYEVHYASNFNNPVYDFNIDDLKSMGIILHQIDIEKSPKRILENIRAAGQIKKIINEERIDMLHCHNPMGGMAGRIAARFSDIKPYVIYTAHGFHFYNGAPFLNWILFYPAEKIAAKWTDTIITINSEDHKRASEHFKLKKGGYVSQIHSVGIDSERFAPKPQFRAEVKRTLGIPEDTFHIVTAAELNKNKNQRVILKALSNLVSYNIRYSICGKGKEKARLERLIKEYGLEDKVKLLGYRNDMDMILQSADVFAFPSIREGLGVAAVEALACGVPLIAADNRGTREYAVNGYNSLICKYDDTDAFAEAIKKLYSDKQYRLMLAKHCRSSVEAFSRDETKKSMREIYKRADMAVKKSSRASGRR